MSMFENGEYERRKKAVLELVVKHAEAETAFPDALAVAGLCDLPEQNAVHKILKDLCDEGTIKRIGTGWRRRFRVVATGATTARSPAPFRSKGRNPVRNPNSAIEVAKNILRRVGFAPVCDAVVVYPQEPAKIGKFIVCGRIVSKKELLSMAERWKGKLAA